MREKREGEREKEREGEKVTAREVYTGRIELWTNIATLFVQRGSDQGVAVIQALFM